MTRRQLIRLSGSAAGAIGLTHLGALEASAQNNSDYRALVCVFLEGGNDSHNMVIPQSQGALNLYKAARGSLALPDTQSKVLPITSRLGIPYGLNSGLGSIHHLWALQKLAVVANVGTLVQPTSRQQYLDATVRLPNDLFSHVDQTAQMQSGDPTGTSGTGWAGRLSDATKPLNGTANFPSAISLGGPSLFCASNNSATANFLPGFNLTVNGMKGGADLTAQKVKSLQQIISFDSGLALVQAANKVRQEAFELEKMFLGLGVSQFRPVFPETNIGRQLLQVAQIINLRNTTGMKRQVFFCSMPGFDTHTEQAWGQWNLLKQVGDAMSAFYNSTMDMGVADQVTTFSESEFGRTLQSSGNGSDHGWGSHHFVMGGAVKGGDIYGTFPNLSLNGPDDATGRGVLIPTTSIDQYAATLAKWFGLSGAAVLQVFPNLNNFSATDITFLS